MFAWAFAVFEEKLLPMLLKYSKTRILTNIGGYGYEQT